MATILEKLQEKYADVNGIGDARNIAEAAAIINGVGGRGAGAIADQIRKQFTVTYNANGGTGSVAAVIVPDGTSITLDDGSNLSYTDKTFSGWATESSATEADVTSPYAPTGDVTLYAVWVAST